MASDMTDEATPLLRARNAVLRVPLWNRVFGGGAQYRTKALLRAESMRAAAAGERPGEERREGLKSVLAELEANEGVSRRYIAVGLFAIFNHFAGGVISMMYLEEWSLPDAAYFCVVTLTTVGYGDLSPSTNLSKLFVIYYVAVSIAIVSSYLAYFVGLFIDQQEEVLLARVLSPNEPEEPQVIDEEGAILRATECLDAADYGGMAFSVTFLGIVMAVGMFLFSYLENFRVLDALYATIISATTVGFGDLHPQHESTKLCMTIWLVFSTIAVAKVVADFTEARVKAKQRALARRVLTASVDRQSLQMLDENKDGCVEFGEFLGAMLVSCGKITREELETFRMRFNQLDADGDAKLTDLDCRLRG